MLAEPGASPVDEQFKRVRAGTSGRDPVTMAA
jgi:hypothetical protein